MLLKFETKQKQMVDLNLDNMKKIEHKVSNYVRIYFNDGTEINLSYNSKVFSKSFITDYELTIAQLNNLITEIQLMQ